MSWITILKQELEIRWTSKDGKAFGYAFYHPLYSDGNWEIWSFIHDAEKRQGLGEKYLKEMIKHLLSMKKAKVVADETLPQADEFWNKMLSKNIIQSIRRMGER